MAIKAQGANEEEEDSLFVPQDPPTRVRRRRVQKSFSEHSASPESATADHRASRRDGSSSLDVGAEDSTFARMLSKSLSCLSNPNEY